MHESGEMYLETIYILQQMKGNVRSVDVSGYMGYSKPSVSRGVSLLKADGYLTVEKDGALKLTQKGLDLARKTFERHTVLSDFFIKLGVSEPAAVDDACRIEHCISDETFEALKKHISASFSAEET
ncbi:MAG: metal-dependent transcriptional regulator [Clostridia bacterium]|nr:metal-dependent transcriptional regulator [Clostridia bacterium]